MSTERERRLELLEAILPGSRREFYEAEAAVLRLYPAECRAAIDRLVAAGVHADDAPDEVVFLWQRLDETERADFPEHLSGIDASLIVAHQHCTGHRTEIEASEKCGCFHCNSTFPPTEITEWIDSGTTALCPRCGIDSVLGSASGFELSPEFLQKMNTKWFGHAG